MLPCQYVLCHLFVFYSLGFLSGQLPLTASNSRGSWVANFYLRFIQGYSKVVAPLASITSILKAFQSSNEAKAAFCQMKSLFACITAGRCRVGSVPPSYMLPHSTRGRPTFTMFQPCPICLARKSRFPLMISPSKLTPRISFFIISHHL